MRTITALILVTVILFGANFILNNHSTHTPLQYTSMGVKAPELAGITGYINTSPNLTIASLRGKVVMIDFWTYSCINCIRTLPHEIAWYNKYHKYGFEIIGVQTPEFNFEKNITNVENFVKSHNITYPVVLDNNYDTWSAYQNNYWPHEYLIDANGTIRYDAVGEGQYTQTENEIRALLTENGANLSEVSMTGVPDMTPREALTQEIYAGYSFAQPRSENLGNPGSYGKDTDYNYSFSSVSSTGELYLKGIWEAAPSFLISKSNDSSITLYYTASSLNMVAQPFESSAIAVVKLDGQYLTKSEAGTDILFNGKVSYINITQARLYNLISQDYGYYKTTISVGSGAAVNSFTFG